MSDALARHVAHILRHVWDPIGLGAIGPADEYDAYVPDVAALVQSKAAFEPALVAHLERIETEAMMLRSARANRAARALLGLREAFSRAPDTLAAQAVGSDGSCCVWIFRRPDALYVYEHAVLRHEADKNGTWSWWADAGNGRSGLFPTFEATVRDARASIDWLRDAELPIDLIDTQWRAVRPSELEVLKRLFTVDFPGRDDLAVQARSAMVQPIDGEGSLRFRVNGPAAEVRHRVPVEGRYLDAGATDPLGPAVNLLLHVLEGSLYELEIYKDDGSAIILQPFDVDRAKISILTFG